MTAPPVGALTQTGALIDHILSRTHETHGPEWSGRIALADRVAMVHATDLQAPKALASAPSALAHEMELHVPRVETAMQSLGHDTGSQ